MVRGANFGHLTVEETEAWLDSDTWPPLFIVLGEQRTEGPKGRETHQRQGFTSSLLSPWPAQRLLVTRFSLSQHCQSYARAEDLDSQEASTGHTCLGRAIPEPGRSGKGVCWARRGCEKLENWSLAQRLWPLPSCSRQVARQEYGSVQPQLLIFQEKLKIGIWK